MAVHDAATRWVSPFFIDAPGPDGRPGIVNILNLGPDPAEVSVTFTEFDGSRWAVSTKKVEPRTIGRLWPDWDGTFVGWLRVDSDKPVFPYADCLAAGTAFGKYVVVASFYRAEGLGTEAWVRATTKMVAVTPQPRGSTERSARRVETVLRQSRE